MPDPVSEPANGGSELTTPAIRSQREQLHRWLIRRLPNPDTAEDIAQEVFLRLHRVEKTAFIQKPLAYLYGIAFNVISEFRMAETRDRVVCFDSDAVERADQSLQHAIADQAAERLNLQRQLQDAFAKLPEPYQIVVLLCKRDGMSYEEASAVSGLSVHTVEKYLVRARAILSAQAWDR